MILTFSDTKFVERILSGEKLFTLRKSDRIKPGMKLQLWLHNPRNVSKNPRKFADAYCGLVDQVEIEFEKKCVWVIRNGKVVHFIKTSYFNINDFAEADGFDSWNDLKKFFIEDQKHDPTIPLTLNRIWFTNVSPV